MNKSTNPIPIYFGAFFAVCIIWIGISILVYGNYLFSAFFLCVFAAGAFLRYLEKDLLSEKSEGLERKIKRLEAKAWYFESIVTNSKDIVFTTDIDHRIVKFNKGSEQVFGVMALEVLGKHVHTLFEDADRIDDLLHEVETTGRARTIELKVRNKETKEEFWISVGVSKLFDRKEGDSKLMYSNKQFIGEIFTCKNITHLRLLEEELKEKNEQLTRLSITDSLTSLFNVRHLKTEASRLQKMHNRYPERPLSIALIDVDKFKEYNDNFGHLAGDNLLISLANIIRAQIRKDLDTAYRYGGDEFVLLFPETDSQGSKIICQRILFEFVGMRLGETSLSLGITQYDRKWGLMSANLLVAKADEAMYMVKCKGGNGVHIFGEPLPKELADRVVTNSPDKLR